MSENIVNKVMNSVVVGSDHRSVPVGLRVFASCSQGGRKYMEDNYDLKYQFNARNELQYIYLAIFDGHGGDVAAKYAKQHLCHNIIRQRGFWSNGSDEEVLNAIKKGFIQTHYDMRKQVVNWPKTASGLPSTSGTTASIVFIMNGKYYTGHVGDSRIVLGRKHEATGKWMSSSLTRDHKPESPREKRRIEAAGGQVMNKSGVERVVWNRPKPGHKGPVRRSTSFDQIPFLAVARSLGDLWSFNSANNTFIVSPEPDVKCIPIDGNDMCLLLASDGLWNMMTTQTAVKVIQEVEEDQYSPELLEAIFGTGSTRLSPSRALVHFCLNRWYQSRFRADNTTVLAVMIEDNQGLELPKANQNLPMSSLFSDSEEDESDDGYDETLDGMDFYDHFSGGYKTNSDNNNDLKNKCCNSSTIVSTTTTAVNTSLTESTVPEPKDTSITTELSQITSSESKTDDNERTVVLTPLLNCSPNFESNNNNILQTTESISSPQTVSSNPMPQPFGSLDDNDSQSNESSRDSGTASPPTDIAISAADELTEEEYSSLPSLVNLSQNEWELYVVIDPKNLSVDSNDFNTLSICGAENSYAVEGQSSLANLNKVIEDNTSLNNYIYSKTGFIRHQSQSLTPNSITTDPSDLFLSPNDNYWSESSSYLQMTSIKPRSSLPLSFVDNHSIPETNCSPILSFKDRTSSAIGDNNLCIFGALKSNCSNSSNTSDNSLQKLSQIFTKSNNNIEIKSETNISRNGRKNTILRQSQLLRRISIDNNGTNGRLRVSLPSRSGGKRKSCSSDYSPPSKHLRSSLWTRPLLSKEQSMRMNFTRSLKQLAVGRLTRSRLRPIKLLKSFNKK